MSPSDPPLLFVYGTLMRGEPAHGKLAGAPFAGEAWTTPGFELVHLGEYPGLVAGGRMAVCGELYRAHPGLLLILDEYEDAPRMYERRPVTLTVGNPAIAYFLRSSFAHGRPRVRSGDWRRRRGK